MKSSFSFDSHGNIWRIVLNSNQVSSQDMGEFAKLYTQKVHEAYTAQKKKRVLIDLTKLSYLSPLVATQLAMMLVRTVPQTSEVYEVVCMQTESKDFIQSVINFLQNFVQLDSPMHVFSDLDEANKLLLSTKTPPRKIVFH